MKYQPNLKSFIQQNAFEIVVWKMAAILSRLQCVNSNFGYQFTIIST